MIFRYPTLPLHTPSFQAETTHLRSSDYCLDIHAEWVSYHCHSGVGLAHQSSALHSSSVPWVCRFWAFQQEFPRIPHYHPCVPPLARYPLYSPIQASCRGHVPPPPRCCPSREVSSASRLAAHYRAGASRCLARRVCRVHSQVATRFGWQGVCADFHRPKV